MLQKQAVCGIIKSQNNYLLMGFKNIDLGNEKSWEKLGKYFKKPHKIRLSSTFLVTKLGTAEVWKDFLRDTLHILGKNRDYQFYFGNSLGEKICLTV